MTMVIELDEGLRRPLRASAPPATQADQLGLLADLPGTWVGGGFNVVALPTGHGGFRLKLNATIETLSFTPVGGAIPNRGSVQGDISLFGLHYLQQVSDSTTFEGLHVEPGLWLNVPATTDPEAPATIVRQSTIPHGDSLLAQSTFLTDIAGGPTIDEVSTIPTGDDPKLKRTGYTDPYLNPALPAGIPRGAQINPNILLTNALEAQAEKGMKVVRTQVIQVSTQPVGGIVNIPFVTANANATKLDAIFWIETVEQADGTQFQQLQYTQTVILNFDNIDWPHISVATLVKQ
ncbi:heme-binding protein [Azospirillum sp.]|uniref:heme-binding protein n=1 Tax=Azospirillum sp. TaxID=34012 RepID=UPI003D7460D0